MSTRVVSIVRKEFVHIRRDPRTLIIIFVMPVFMLLMYGYAINMEIQKIEMAVLDHSRTLASSDLVEAFRGSEFFSVRYTGIPGSEIGDLFQSRQATMALIIPADFARTMGGSTVARIQMLIDASDSNTAQLVRNYSIRVLQQYNAARGITLPFEARIRIEYNPTLKSSYFFVPALVALILMMISALLTSVTIAREKETGTLEQILVSPVRPAEIIVGKVVPYILLAFIDANIILLVAHFWFKVPIFGSLALILGASLVFVFVALAIGLFISTRVGTQQVAMMAALVSSLLPTIMLSGFIFPIASMPRALQLVTYIVPARYFLQILRGVMLKGNTLSQIALPLLVLIAMGIAFTVISAKRFKMTLET